MYLALLTYKGPPESLEPYLEEHRAFLKEGYSKNILIVSGQMMPDKGGVIFSSLTRLGEFEQFLRQDPFIKHGLVSYEIIAFEPSRFHPDFKPFVREPEREAIELVPHMPEWETVFQKEAAAISQALGDNLEAIHHIGSTSIPGIVAKPIVDILPVVKDIKDVDRAIPEMEALGYEAWGEYGLPGRCFFIKRSEGKRVFNVHIFQKGHPDIDRHLIFRDYLRTHPDEASLYSDLKKKLVKVSSTDIEKYCWGKDDFVKDIQKKAMAWHGKICGNGAAL